MIKIVKVPISPITGIIIYTVLSVLGFLLIDAGESVGILLILFGVPNIIINLPGFFRQLSARSQVSSLKTRFKLVVEEMEKENYQMAINHLNVLPNNLLSPEGRLIANSLLSRCYFQLGNHVKAYSFTKQIFSSVQFKPAIEDYLIKFLCEINLKMSSEAKATLAEAFDKFPNNPKLNDPSLQILGEMISTTPDLSESSASISPIPGTTIDSIPVEEIF